ncbi:hypothetical protein FRC07_006858 [Ceratobasidium sp. 392]|nr:hypothetical protein FRC07_006858 [Ceratobasidium sp. 392]
MAGPPRTTQPSPRSPFDHDIYSPLTNLVRKASLNHSSSAGGVPTYSSLGMNRSTGQTSAESRPLNMRSVSDQTHRTNVTSPPKKGIPPSLVLDKERDQAHQSHRRAQPSSPLLHTRFRASVATSIGSSSDLDPRDSQEVEYPFHHHHPNHRQQPSSASGSESAYTPSPTTHRPFAYVIDDTHAAPSPTSQYSVGGGPVSPNQPFQFDTRTSVAPSEDIRPPFQYDPRASSISASTDAPFQYDDRSSKLGLSAVAAATSRASNASYNPRGTWRSSNAPDPDPFSFRDYESPRVEPPIVVVHSPMSTIQDLGDEDVDRDQFFLGDAAQQRPGPSHGNGDAEEDVGSTSYHDAYEYVYGAIEADDQNQGPDSEPTSATEQSFFAPEPTVVVTPATTMSNGGTSAGRAASVVAGGGRYNYSRPMRSAANGSVSSLQGSQSGQDEPSTGTSPGVGKSPLRQATGPLIFQNAEEGRASPDSRSPSPGYIRQPPSSQPYPPSANRSPNMQPQQPRGQSPLSPHLNSPDPQRPPSLYSQYSFYSLPNSTPPDSPHATQGQHPQLRQKPSGSNLNPNTPSPKDKPPSAAQQYLTRGIAAHEQNNLRESARCFERSATAEGGCGVGMLMWGLSLRHGWGCRKDERTGFKWLRRAAEAAVSDLESARSGEEAKAVRNELVLAIYEVGQCFFHGWGVGQDRPMAVSYFQVAARLGDCDAQQELAFCYLNGKGCKKDMKEAARWYRAAASQGASTVGLAWIYKPNSEFEARTEFVPSRFREALTELIYLGFISFISEMNDDARRVCSSDKARLLTALIIAKTLPVDHTPLSYILKLRDVFPISSRKPGATDTGDRLIHRIAELERRVELARADEAQAKLGKSLAHLFSLLCHSWSLISRGAKHPPVTAPVAVGENEVAGSSKRPGSPSSGNKKTSKKKKKQPDTGSDDRVWFEERSTQLDAALDVIQKCETVFCVYQRLITEPLTPFVWTVLAFDPQTYLKNTGLIASLLRLRGAPAVMMTVQPTVVPLLQRCLTDASAHVRHVCAYPTLQTSLDSLNAIQTLLPELLFSIQDRTPQSAVDDSAQELTRILAHDLIEPVIRAIHPASIAILSRASSATRSRTRRGKLKAGARAAREAEEAQGEGLVDVRPGLLNVISMVAKAVKGGGMMYAVLPIAFQLVRELVLPKRSAPGSGAGAKSAHRIQCFAAADSLWYLSSACHAVLEHAAPFAPDDAEILSRCSEMLVAVLTATEARASQAVRDMLCALLERIMFGFPS